MRNIINVFQRLWKASISKYILLTIIPPMVCLVLYSMYFINDARELWHSSHQMNYLQEITSLSLRICNVVHELQRERGISTAFMKSDGKIFREGLRDQRKRTDSALNIYNTETQGFDFAAHIEEFVLIAQSASLQLNRFDNIRRQVDGLSFSSDHMFDYYTNTIEMLISVIALTAAISTDVRISNAIFAYMNLIIAKEYCGQERDICAKILSSKKFSTSLHQRLLRLIAKQELFLKTFYHLISRKHQVFFNKMMEDKSIREVKRIRSIAIKSSKTGNTKGGEPAYWLDVIKSKIEILKQMENCLNNDLIQIASRISNEATNRLMMTIVWFGVILLVTIGIIWIAMHNLAEQNHVQKWLMEGEEGLGEAQSHSSIGHWKWDLTDNIFIMSNEMCSIFGISGDRQFNNLQMMLEAHIHPDDRDIIGKAIKEVVTEDDKHPVSYRIILPNGKIRYIIATVPEVQGYDDENNSKILIGRVQDITEQWRKGIISDGLLELGSKKGQQGTGEKLLAFINSSTDIFEIYDLELNLIEINNAGLKMIGMRREEALGLNISKIVPYFSGQDRTDKLHEVIRTGVQFFNDNVIFHSDSGDRFLAIKSFKVGDGLGLIISDISQWRESAHLLEKSEKHYRTLIENSSDLIMLIDEDGSIIYNSPSISGMLGYDEYELIGKRLNDYIFPADMSGVFPGILYEKNGRKDSEFRMRNRDGVWRVLETSSRIVFNDGNEMSAIILNSRDITDKKEIHNRLIKSKDAAERANLSKTHFFINLSQGLSTLLNSVVGFSQFLEKKLEDNPNKRLKGYVSTMRISSFHILGILKDIIDLSNIETGKLRLEKNNIDLRNFFKQVSLSVRSLVKEKGILFNVKIDKDIGSINADEVRLNQIIYNFLSNAIKFTEKGKRVIIFASREGNSLKITVADEGIGFPLSDIRRIFEPFEQMRDDNIVKNYGSGLGLPIAKKLVSMHGGRISVKSKIGKGSVFTIRLPVRIPVEGANRGRDTLENVKNIPLGFNGRLKMKI